MNSRTYKNFKHHCNKVLENLDQFANYEGNVYTNILIEQMGELAKLLSKALEILDSVPKSVSVDKKIGLKDDSQQGK